MSHSVAPQVDRPVTIAVLVVMGALVSFVLIIAPGLVGAFITTMDFSPQQAGYLISVELAGLGLAALPGMYWLNRVSWLQVCRICLPLLAICHLLSAQVSDFQWLLLLRLVSGLLGGSAMCICLAALGMSRHTERNLGLWVVAQLVLGAAGLAALPHMVDLWGVPSIFITASAAVALLSLFIRHVPPGRSQPAQPKHVTHQQTHLMHVLIGLVGLLAFYLSLSGTWAYLERIGQALQLSASDIGYYLSVASVMGIAGAVSATLLSNRLGRLMPGTGGLLMMLLAIALLLTDPRAAGYLLAACVFKYAWTFVLPYLLAAINNADSSGRAIVVANVVIGTGLAGGPALAAAMLGEDGYDNILWTGVAMMTLALLLFVPVFLFADRRDAQRSAYDVVDAA